MLDRVSQKPLDVWALGTAPPYLLAPVSQLGEIMALLDSNRVRYQVDDFTISFDDEPEAVWITFGGNTDPKVIQDLLNNAP